MTLREFRRMHVQNVKVKLLSLLVIISYETLSHSVEFRFKQKRACFIDVISCNIFVRLTMLQS